MVPDQGEGEQKRKATYEIRLSSPLSREGEGGWGGEVCGNYRQVPSTQCQRPWRRSQWPSTQTWPARMKSQWPPTHT